MNDNDILIFSNEPLPPSKTTVTLSILSQENVLKGTDTRGVHDLPQRTAYYEELTFFIDLATPDVVAYDLFPDGIISEVEETKTYTLSPQVMFKEVGISLGQVSK